jgi:competence protein ComGC
MGAGKNPYRESTPNVPSIASRSTNWNLEWYELITDIHMFIMLLVVQCFLLLAVQAVLDHQKDLDDRQQKLQFKESMLM